MGAGEVIGFASKWNRVGVPYVTQHDVEMTSGRVGIQRSTLDVQLMVSRYAGSEFTPM